MNRSDFLPFSAVVGQDEAKLALILTAVDRRIGGVLLRGDKGSAKSTLARGLAALLPGEAPFVELPLGATEDRVVGSIDLAAALTGGERRFDAGLLHAADGGILYVDEINLLPDHLVDVLLDVAASGVNRVEREGVSHSHTSRFVLIGSMNPEEGDLRPQLLDRFGLAVDVHTPAAGDERTAALRRRLRFDADRDAVVADVAEQERAVATKLAITRPALLPDAILEAVAGICAAAGAEGLRADLTICRAAAALAGWEGRAETAAADVRRVAPLALAHRARRDPLDPPGHDRERLEQALDDHLDPAPAPNRDPPPDRSGDGDGGADDGSDEHDGDGRKSAGNGDAGETVHRPAAAAAPDLPPVRRSAGDHPAPGCRTARSPPSPSGPPSAMPSPGTGPRPARPSSRPATSARRCVNSDAPTSSSSPWTPPGRWGRRPAWRRPKASSCPSCATPTSGATRWPWSPSGGKAPTSSCAPPGASRWPAPGWPISLPAAARRWPPASRPPWRWPAGRDRPPPPGRSSW